MQQTVTKVRKQKAMLVAAVLLCFILPAAGFYAKMRSYGQYEVAASLVQASTTPLVATTASAATTSESLTKKAVTYPQPTVARSQTYSSTKLTFTEAESILQIIAKCESDDNPLAKNPGSSAKGLLQILDSTWNNFGCTGSVYDPDDNMSCGIKIAMTSGLHHWNPSRSCWGPAVAKQDLAIL